MASAALRNPAALKETAPATFNVNFATSAGTFVVQVTRAWAPKGADRFYNLVKHGYYNDGRFFRVVPNFMVQFGINGDPKVQEVWREATIADEPVTQSNKRGFITFAKSNAPNSRTTQVFINFADNSRLDAGGFAPFGQVISGMEIVDKINAEYGEEPNQGRIQFEGNAYLAKEFPRLTVMKSVTIARPAATTDRASQARGASQEVAPGAKPPVLGRRPAAADVEHRAGRERALFGREPADQRRDLLHFEKPAESESAPACSRCAPATSGRRSPSSPPPA